MKKSFLTFLLSSPVIFFMIMCTVIVMMISGDNEIGNDEIGGGDGEYVTNGISPEVERFRAVFEKYARQEGVYNYLNVIMALTMQESGGRYLDIMQSSESIGLPPNSITDPELSIKIGVKYFAQVIKQAKGDIKLALQSYNFGNGFINYALSRGGYSKEVAQSFSNMMAVKMGWSRYGDIHYIDHVMRYLEAPSTAAGKPNTKGFITPINGTGITSRFGYRKDPFGGGLDLHEGLDFGCNKQALPIFATKSGTVKRAGWENPADPKKGYGQRIYIDHGGSITTIYAHLSKMYVESGEKVNAGQPIGSCGMTGSSTGMHLHFEVLVDGRKVNPEDFLY